MRKMPLLFLFLSFACSQHPLADPQTSPDFGPSQRILVRYRDGANRQATQLSAGARSARRFSRLSDMEVVEASGSRPIEDVLAELRRNPNVLYAEPSHPVSIHATPNDPSFSSLWGLSTIRAPQAWDSTTGSNNIVIAVVDTGVDYTHPDLAANMWINPGEIAGNGIDDDNNGWVDDIHGINPLYGNGDPRDDHNHGTHVAGTIAAAGNNGVGITGVNWNTKIIACKFLDAEGFGESDVATVCLDYLLDLKTRAQNPVNIVLSNHSWGGGPYSNALRDAIAAHRDAGMLLVASAGNSSADMDIATQYPSGYDVSNILAVAATDQTDARAWFSNYGRHLVDIGAPGVNILSTVIGNQYSAFQGTSMAAPHVSGLIGLLKAQDPSRNWIQLKNLVLAGGERTAAMAGSTLSGRRLLAAGTNGTGSLTCLNQVVAERMEPAEGSMVVEVGATVRFSALHINCAQPAGAISLSVNSSGTLALADAGFNDGTYSANYVVATPGTHTLTFPWGDTVTIRTASNYLAPTPVANQARTIAGTTLAMTDNAVATVTSPFPIRLGGYQTGYTTVNVSSNGNISFTTNNNSPYHAAMPTAMFDTLVSVFWDDFNPAAAGSVVWAVLGTSPNRELVVEWRNVRHRWVVTSNATFQAVFFENSPDVLFNYQDVMLGTHVYDRAANGTVGIQISKYVVRQHSFNLASINNGTGLLFSTSVSSPNLPPTAFPDSVTTGEDNSVIIPVTANDTDPEGNPLEIVWADQGLHGIVDYVFFSTNNAITYYPDWNYTGNDSFTYIVSDGRGGTSMSAVSIAVVAGNDPPIARNDTAVTTIGAPITISVLANDTDADGDPLSVTSATQPAHGTRVINANGTISYTPAAGYFGADSFSYTITDGVSGNATATVNITVQSGLTITSISPSTVGFGTHTFTINGTGFAAGATLSFTGGTGNTPVVNSLTVQSSTRIVATVNVPSGGARRTRRWNVTVRLPNGATATLSQGLTVIP